VTVARATLSGAVSKQLSFRLDCSTIHGAETVRAHRSASRRAPADQPRSHHGLPADRQHGESVRSGDAAQCVAAHTGSARCAGPPTIRRARHASLDPLSTFDREHRRLRGGLCFVHQRLHDRFAYPTGRAARTIRARATRAPAGMGTLERAWEGAGRGVSPRSWRAPPRPRHPSLSDVTSRNTRDVRATSRDGIQPSAWHSGSDFAL
jgi:hypothetical protein